MNLLIQRLKSKTYILAVLTALLEVMQAYIDACMAVKERHPKP